MKLKYILLTLPFLLLSATTTQRTCIYVNELSKNKSERSLVLNYSGDVLVAEQISPGMKEKMYMSEDHQLSRWVMENSNKKIDISGERKGNEIILTGTKKGKDYDKNHEIDGNPWFQAWELGLEPFVKGGEKEMKFWSVSPQMLRIGLFTAVKTGLEEIELNATKKSAERVDITMKGFSPKLFHCEFWFHPETGVMLRSHYKIFGSESGEYLKELK
jgi:hypothetical protein